MIKFKGLSIDPSYKHEDIFYKTIVGEGFKNDRFCAYIWYNFEWIQINKDTLEIIGKGER